MVMVRKQIYLTKELDEKVKELAKARNVPEAEIIRLAIEQYGEYRVDASRGRTEVRETATLPYRAGTTMNGNEEWAERVRRINEALNSGAGLRALEIARERVGAGDGGERGWTREDLYDERPKYLSR